MKIETYNSEKGTRGYRLIAEDRDEREILDSLRCDAFRTDGLFKYEGCERRDQNNPEQLVTQVRFRHNISKVEMLVKMKEGRK